MINKKDGAIEKQSRYFISSHWQKAAFFNQTVRSHWGIENQLHWSLDVSFGEDKSQKRAGYAQKISLINKIALNLTKNYEDKRDAKKVSVKTKTLKCGWDNNYLLKILTIRPAIYNAFALADAVIHKFQIFHLL